MFRGQAEFEAAQVVLHEAETSRGKVARAALVARLEEIHTPNNMYGGVTVPFGATVAHNTQPTDEPYNVHRQGHLPPAALCRECIHTIRGRRVGTWSRILTCSFKPGLFSNRILQIAHW